MANHKIIKEFQVVAGGVRVSNIEDVMKIISTYLYNKVPNNTTLEDYLLKDFVYPDSLGRFNREIRRENDRNWWDLFYDDAYNLPFLIPFEKHYVSSIIEALIFDFPKQLQELLAELKKKDERFFQAFLNALKRKNLCGDEFLSDDVSKLHQTIDALSAYGEKNKNRPDKLDKDRGQAAIDLANDLRARVTNFQKPLNDVLVDEKQNHSSSQNKVVLVSHKLDFLHCLHSKDKEFEKHHGWKRVISNIALCLCTGVVPYLIGCAIKWGRTGHFFVNDQTTTAEKIEGIHKIIDPELNLKF